MSDSENQKSDTSQPAFSPWALWERYNAGEDLSPQQSNALRESLQRDTEFRRDALAERTVDQMLRIEAETPDESEAFVARVLAKCHTSTNEATTNSNARLLDRALLQNIAKDRQNTQRERTSWNRPSSAWLAIAAAVVVSLTGFGVWYQNQNVANKFGANQSNQSSDLAVISEETGPMNEASTPETPQSKASDGLVQNRTSELGKVEDSVVESQNVVLPENSLIPDQSSIVFATVTETSHLSDSTKLVKGMTIGEDRIEIPQGEIVLSMADGATVNVFAPCRLELLSGNSLRLTSGELSVSVANESTRFQVKTPAIAVTNSGSVFDIVVEETGRTEVEVRRGEIAVEAIDYPNAQAWSLNADTTSFLTIYTPVRDSKGGHLSDIESIASDTIRAPIASLAKSLSGEAKGVITFNGQSRSFDDEVVFSKVREQVFQGAKSPGERFVKDWSRFVETATNQPQPAGSIQLNGKEYAFDNYNEAVLAQNNVLAQFAPTEKSIDSSEQSDDQSNAVEATEQLSGSFHGTVFIRGQRRDFRTFEEYRAAMKELMGPAAEFGFFPFGK
ncbi:MAG: FecR family protein [Pirellula sp.]|jgi:hypothetical protein|nr:FecR family protein [Pirellula sp.]